MQRFTLALWIMYCVHRFRVGLAMELQMFRPYGAGSVVRCSLLDVREKRPHPSPSPDMRGKKQLGNFLHG
ncbi:MAG: hypothetical protein WHS63_12870 [Tenuifilum sp.]